MFGKSLSECIKKFEVNEGEEFDMGTKDVTPEKFLAQVMAGRKAVGKYGVADIKGTVNGKRVLIRVTGGAKPSIMQFKVDDMKLNTPYDMKVTAFKDEIKKGISESLDEGKSGEKFNDMLRDEVAKVRKNIKKLHGSHMDANAIVAMFDIILMGVESNSASLALETCDELKEKIKSISF